jgi:tricarballylate dehydrogenase
MQPLSGALNTPVFRPQRPAYDVVVVGGGNAAVCAAFEACHAGASVLIVEAAPMHMRGGNSRHTRNVRYMHIGDAGAMVGTYTEDEFYADLLQVTGGETNEDLARFTIRQSESLAEWMPAHGIKWQSALRGTLQLARTNAFFLGGGKALLNTYYELASPMGIEVVYEAPVDDVVLRDGSKHPHSLFLETPEGRIEVGAKSIVVASGGFEANLDWLGLYWGEAAQNFFIRGTPFNRGRMLRVFLDKGARAVGNEREFHAVAVDARGPQFDGGIVTRLDTVPFSIVVNKHGRRFSDEGVDIWPKRYAVWGGLIARQDGQVAYSIMDSKTASTFMPSAFPGLKANSVHELALMMGLDPETVVETVTEYNNAVVPGTFDTTKLDDCHTEGLEVEKSHWAVTLDTPPFIGYPLRPGITFTYYGLGVNERAQVLDESGQPMPNVFAAGEVMSGNILGRGYMAGFGMTIGSVWGRIAGREAGQHALS